MTHAQIGNLYLTSIVHLEGITPSHEIAASHRPIGDGLAIEYQGAKSRFVIAFIRYNEDEEDCYLETVGNRLIKYITSETWDHFTYLYRYGRRMICDEHERSIDIADDME